MNKENPGRNKEGLSPEEEVKAFIYPHGLSDGEKATLDKEMRETRFRLLREMTEEQRIYASLVRLKLQIKDYIAQDDYTPKQDFAYYLKEYLRILNRQKKDFAGEINLHSTKLSRILNAKEAPNLQLMYRLEKHSGQVIKAILWWKLYGKSVEHEVKKNDKLRMEEQKKVSNPLEFSFLKRG